MTPTGIEPATFRFVTQHLSHLCYRGSPMHSGVSEKDVPNTKRPAAIIGCKNRGRRHCVRSPAMAMLSVTCNEWLLPIRSRENTASLYVQNNTSALDRCYKLQTLLYIRVNVLLQIGIFISAMTKCMARKKQDCLMFMY